MSDRHRKAVRHLCKVDHRLAGVIKRVGVCQLARQGGTFSLLAKSILSQQISTQAARTIRRRLEGAMPNRRMTASAIRDLTDEEFQACGVSQQKRRYLRDLADHVVSERLSFRRLAVMTDEEVISALVQVKGVGRWTAQMFLLAGLGRPDIFASGDLGLQNGIVRLYNLKARPTRNQLLAISAPWSPFRSIASWYLWRSLDDLNAREPVKR